MANADILSALFAHARAHGKPYVALGDWNMDPIELQPLLLQCPTAHVIYDTENGTCRTATGDYTVRDYAIVDSRMHLLLHAVEAKLDVPLSPHRVIGVACRMNGLIEVPTLLIKLRLSTENICGPMPPLDHDITHEEVLSYTRTYDMLIQQWQDKAQRPQAH